MSKKYYGGNQPVSVCVFLIMVMMAIGAGYYKNTVVKERVYFSLSLPQQHPQTIMIDLADQGWPKYVVQPGIVMISNGIKNNSHALLMLQIKVTGLLENAQVSSNTHNLEVTNNGYLTQLAPGEKLKLNVNLDIPRQQIQEREIGIVTIEFFDEGTQHMLGQVTFDLRNSRNPNNIAIP